MLIACGRVFRGGFGGDDLRTWSAKSVAKGGGSDLS